MGTLPSTPNVKYPAARKELQLQSGIQTPYFARRKGAAKGFPTT